MAADTVNFYNNGKYSIGSIEEMDVKKERKSITNSGTEQSSTPDNAPTHKSKGTFDISSLRRMAGINKETTKETNEQPVVEKEPEVQTRVEQIPEVYVTEEKPVIQHQVEESTLVEEHVEESVQAEEQQVSTTIIASKNTTVPKMDLNKLRSNTSETEVKEDVAAQPLDIASKEDINISTVSAVVDGVSYHVVSLKDFVANINKSVQELNPWFNSVVKNWVKNPGGFFGNSSVNELFVNCITSISTRKSSSVVLVLTYGDCVTSCSKSDKSNVWEDSSNILSIREDAIWLSNKVVSFGFRHSKDVLVL